MITKVKPNGNITATFIKQLPLFYGLHGHWRMQDLERKRVAFRMQWGHELRSRGSGENRFGSGLGSRRCHLAQLPIPARCNKLRRKTSQPCNQLFSSYTFSIPIANFLSRFWMQAVNKIEPLLVSHWQVSTISNKPQPLPRPQPLPKHGW